MHLDRRNFIKSSLGFAGGLALGGLGACAKKEPAEPWAGFKYAMCNESMRELSWAKQCQIIGEAGYTGVEIAAFTLVRDNVNELEANHRTSLVNDMKVAGIECVGLHWLLAPPPKGLHFTTPDTEVREKTVNYLKDLINFCSDLGGTVMIFGSPKQRNTVDISIVEAKKYFADGLAQVADLAQQRGVQILLEPLDKSQTDVVNTLAEAKEIIEKINHPAIQTMFDFHNTPDETEPFDVLIKKYYPYIYHVHVQEMDGKHLGQGDAVTHYVKAFQQLKDLNYNKWVSLEVFDFEPGGATIAEESMDVLKQIEAKLI
ncbi:sugar phosphate isomerase/epimerase [candidate division KSB1 bacterium]|nr:sugar phosphate isomerase/epimerase [candidate division KSB1 bacterium]